MNYSTHFAVLPYEPSAVLAKFLLHPGFRSARGKLFNLGGPIQKFMHNVRKRSKTVFMSVAFCRWLSLFSIPFSPGESATTVCRGWVCIRALVQVCTEALAYRSIAHVQRLVRPLLADDNVCISRPSLGRSRKTWLLGDCMKPTRNFVCLVPVPPDVP